MKVYDEMLRKNPKAYTAERMVLNFVDGKRNVQLVACRPVCCCCLTTHLSQGTNSRLV